MRKSHLVLENSHVFSSLLFLHFVDGQLMAIISKRFLALMTTSDWKTLKTENSIKSAQKNRLNTRNLSKSGELFLQLYQIWRKFQESVKIYSSFQNFQYNFAPVHPKKKGADPEYKCMEYQTGA